jgi:hypothetical protein
MHLISKLLLGVIVLAALGTIGVWATNKKTPIASGSSINLYKDSGVVYYKKTTSSEYQILSGLSVELTDGAFVKTEAGRAHVIFPDNSLLSIDENTTIQISYSPTKTSIFQTIGNTYHRVNKLQGNSEYEVKTPGTLAAVRGTKFAVSYFPETKTSKVAVTESRVAVSKLRDGKPATTTEQSVKVGFFAEVKDTDASATSSVRLAELKASTTDARERAWLSRNAHFDAYLDRVERKRDFLEALSKTESDSTDATPGRDLERFRNRLEKTRAQLRTEVRDIDSSLLERIEARIATTTPIINRIATTTPVPTPTFDSGPSGEQDPFLYYFDGYYAFWFKLDATDSVCTYMAGIPADEIIKRLSSLAATYNRELPNAATLSKNFTDLLLYCKTKDPVLRRSLEERYKTDYPYTNEYF